MSGHEGENTPLLSPHRRRLSNIEIPGCPPIGPFVDRLLAHGTGNPSTDEVPPQPPQGVPRKLYEMLVTFMACIRLEESVPTHGVIDSWTAAKARQARRTELAAQADRQWTSLVEDASSDADLADALWLAVPVQEGSRKTIRAIDILAHPHSPDVAVEHDVIEFHAKGMWKYGFRRSTEPDSVTEMILSRYDALATPRSLHLIELIANLAFFGILLNYILDPPSLPVIIQGYLTDFGVRGILLCIYSSAYLSSSRTVRGVPYALLLLNFIVAMPIVPTPGDGTFDILLFTFILHCLLLHIPTLPTPLLLFSSEETLPLATLLWRSFTHTWLPILGFFLPALFLATNLLSISLSDVFFQYLLATPVISFRSLPQAPIETRGAFLSLYLIVILLILTSLAMMVLVFASTYLHLSSTSSRWDRYGKTIGLEARRTFLRSVIAYSPGSSAELPFPIPLNLLPILLVYFPTTIAERLGRTDAGDLRQRGEQILWRVFVVPLAAIPTVFALIWDRNTIHG